jgi:biopolymer transport protein ExbD
MHRPKQRNRVMSEINITPLTDVMMVLLVIFMVTTPLIMKANIDINLPKAHVQKKAETEHIQITLDQKGVLYLDGQKIIREQLPALLAKKMTGHPDPSVTVSADAKVPYGEAVQLLDVARQAGAKKLVLAAEPLPAQPLSQEMLGK